MSKKQHLSRLAAPASWPIERKGIKWVAKPLPGTHSLAEAMPLVIYLRDILGLASIGRNIKRILGSGFVKVNRKTIKEQNFPVGLFDTISIEQIDKHYRVVVDQNARLKLIEIESDESRLLPLKITEKLAIHGGKLQLCFNNGWTILADKKEYAVGDGVVMDVNGKKIKSHLKLEKGKLAYVTSGANAGTLATIKELRSEGLLQKKKIALLQHNKQEFETHVNKLFVVGDGKAEVKLE